jgi:vacuolar-type H+-ATPase subunit D/Vma8
MPEALNQAWPKLKKLVTDLKTAHNALKAAHLTLTTERDTLQKQVTTLTTENGTMRTQVAQSTADAPALADLNEFVAANPNLAQ